MTEWKPAQEASVALILEILEAARAIAARPGAGLAAMFSQEEAQLVTASRMLDGALEQLVPRPTWRTTTWAEVAELGQGTRVRLGAAEAVVHSAAAQDWHVDPRSSEYRPQPLEHRVIAVRLGSGEMLYRFPPAGAVEVLDVEWPKSDLAGWVAAAGAVLECQAMETLNRELGAEQ